jgi:hypothetical protein
VSLSLHPKGGPTTSLTTQPKPKTPGEVMVAMESTLPGAQTIRVDAVLDSGEARLTAHHLLVAAEHDLSATPEALEQSAFRARVDFAIDRLEACPPCKEVEEARAHLLRVRPMVHSALDLVQAKVRAVAETGDRRFRLALLIARDAVALAIAAKPEKIDLAR